MTKKKGMKKRILSIMLCLLMVIGMMPVMPKVMKAEEAKATDLMDSSSGVTLRDADGDRYYDISTEADLIAFSNLVNAGNTTINAKLLANIDMNPGYDFDENGSYTGGSGNVFTWTPIGHIGTSLLDTSDNVCYAGSFNGNGHTISGLYVNDSSKQNLGLFGAVTSNAKIENVGVINSYFSGSGYLGGITGYQKSGLVIISNCYSDATIKGSSNYVGGIAGCNMGRIINCYNTGAVTATGQQGLVGGIAGSNYSNYSNPIENCYYLKGSASKGIPEGDVEGVVESKTEEQFDSGEVAYLLNNNSCCTNGVVSDISWYQTIDTDTVPKLGGQSNEIVHCYVNGDTKEYKNHTHNVQYTASGATITASCDAHCAEDFGSVTIKAPSSLIYDGTQKEVTIEGNLLSEDKSTISVLLKYDGMGQSAPTGAGTHKAEISISASYGNVKASVEYTIQPKEVSSYTAPRPNTLTYNGEAQNLITEGTLGSNDAGFTMKYSLDGIDYKAEIPQAKDADTYTVYCKIEGNDSQNYVSKDLGTIEVTIQKAPLTITGATASGKIYDGKNTVAIDTIVLSGIKSSDDVSVDVSKGTGKVASADAGTYDMVTFEGLAAAGILTGAHAKNYTLDQPTGAVNLSSPVEITPATPEYSDFDIIKHYVYTVDTTESIDLNVYLPENSGSVSVAMPQVSGDITYTSEGVNVDGDLVLSYTVCEGNIGDKGTVAVCLNTQNYGQLFIDIQLELVDKYESFLTSNVTLKSTELIVGNPLSTLEFNRAEFLGEDGEVLEGTLTWKDASIVPTLGTTSATWVFTPANTDLYKTVTGTTTISVVEAPHIQGADGRQGWDVVRDAVADAKEGDTVKVDMNGSLVVEGDVIEDIKGKDITVCFDMGNGIVWSVNGKDVTADNIADINMGVSVSTPEFPLNMIPVEVINAVTGENYHMEINLAHNGEFGFKAVLTLNLEAKNAGLFANLYYYNPQTNKLEFICADEIAADGSTDLAFTHASDYTIVIDDEPADAKTPVTSPNTGQVSGFVFGMMLMMLACGSVLIIRKKNIR